MTQNEKTKVRLHVVDALRGFAIVSIMLLHNIEHFDVYFTPENIPVWMQSVDKVIWETMFFLFGGKSYAMFAILFGLTFHIQRSNQQARGKRFEGRFAWRLLLLFGFGLINSAFFQGDILTIYAALGLFLIPLGRLGNKAILVIAILLLMLPGEWFDLFKALKNPNMQLSNPVSWSYFGKMWEYIPGKSLIATFKGNFINGRTAVLLWNAENGRFFLILSYFLFGLLAGRKNLFKKTNESQRFWLRILVASVLVFIPLHILRTNLNEMLASVAIRRSLQLYVSTYANTAFMVIWVSGFTILFQSTRFMHVLNYFSAFGKMSLSNYVFQSILGSFVYYGFGFGLYKYTGSTYAALIGLTLVVLMGFFCTWWAKKYKRGPLETWWHKATWISLKNENQ